MILARSSRVLIGRNKRVVREVFSKHETWQNDCDEDNVPKVRKRDGTVGYIDKTRGFVDYYRVPEPYRDALTRSTDWEEINFDRPQHDHVERAVQAARCMDCGTPFCQTHTGCPINNLIPEWNDLVFKGQWRQASERLHKTNNFPEFTGRVCPAPCEGSCVAGLVDSPVTIKNIEYAVVDRAWEEGWVSARTPRFRSGRSVAVVGSGPAGLAAADCLNQLGHSVAVYEREDRIGGLLTYGIPNMKLSKATVQRRVNMLAAEGVQFITNTAVGTNVTATTLRSEYDAIVLCLGAGIPRDLQVPGRELQGVHFAMEFLTSNQKRLFLTRSGHLESTWSRPMNFASDKQSDAVVAEGKDVVIIGGGDTGTDCIGTSIRQRCRSVTNIELMSRPPSVRTESNPWPQWPRVHGVDYGHAEAAAVFGQDPRRYSLAVVGFLGDAQGRVRSVLTQEVDWQASGSVGGQAVRSPLPVVPHSEKEWPADLVILSMGFRGTEADPIAPQLGLDLNRRGTFRTSETGFETSATGVFVAGDCRRGQSLVVWAIAEGRAVADKCHTYLTRLEQM